MMMMIVLMLFSYILMVCSNHSFMYLMFLECITMITLFVLLMGFKSMCFGLSFLFTCVCVGSYGVMLVVSMYRMSSSKMALSFNY